ncbi:MAG: peptidase [Flavipsychrobacter sp.]|jgi:aminopeptidase N|nr:peptidase [Flavipsychrobacter sp.]
MKRIPILLAFLFIAFSCFAQVPARDTVIKDTIQHVVLDTLEVSVPAGPVPYRNSATKVWEIKHTRIALSFNFKEKTADVKEWISLTPYFYPVDTLVLDAKSMRIDSVLLVTPNGKVKLKYTYENNQLTIRFGQVFKMGFNIDLYLKYTAMPYAKTSGGSSAIRDDRGLYFINTDYKVPHKPAQIWTQGETESNSHWMITIDKPNTRFTTQIELTVPDSFTTLSNGALIKKTPVIKGMRTDVWKMDMPLSVYTAMFAIGKFKIDKNNWRGKEVSYYVEPEYEQYAYLMFNHTRDMMEYFSQRTGVAYPWNKYSQVVVRDYVSGAMENTSASLFGEFMNQNAREVADKNAEDVVSHELFHQWFGDYVTCESWANITVNESFANYGEQLWRNYRYGKASCDELAYNDLMGYIATSAFKDEPLVRYHYDSREDVFDAISYNKGGAILRYLNNLIGDAAFDKSMNIYLTKNALRPAEAHHWRLAVEEATGQDWGWFFNQWYYKGGHPVLKVSYDYNDSLQKLIVTVKQAQEDSNFMYRLPLKTAIFYDRDKTVIDWEITKKKETFAIPYKLGVAPVVIPDYTHILPGELKDGKKMMQWKVQMTHTDDYISKRLAVNAASKLLSDTNSQAIIDLALKDNIHPIRRHALTQLRNTTNEKYQKRWAEYIISVAKYDSDKLVRAEAFYTLGDWKVAEGKEFMQKATHYSSYAIAGAALEALSKIDMDTAYALAKELVQTDPKASLETSVWTIIGKKGADEDIVLFEKYVPYAFGSKRFWYASAMNNYLKNVKSDDAFKRCTEVFATFVANEGLRNFRSMFRGFLFQLATQYKSDSASEKPEEAETAKRRFELMRPFLQRIIDEETDEDLLKEGKKKIRELYE